MKPARRAFVLALTGILLVGCGPAIPPAGNYATVSGQVVDAASGKGIANATVALNGGVLSAQTDSGGNFHITTVPTGDWDYTVSAQGYNSTGLVTNVAPLSPGQQFVITIQLYRSS
jgi:hypothetical protein